MKTLGRTAHILTTGLRHFLLLSPPPLALDRVSIAFFSFHFISFLLCFCSNPNNKDNFKIVSQSSSICIKLKIIFVSIVLLKGTRM